jgi:hypothetical protein
MNGGLSEGGRNCYIADVSPIARSGWCLSLYVFDLELLSNCSQVLRQELRE